jgi:renalase
VNTSASHARQIAIIGAGLSGLSAAYELFRLAGTGGNRPGSELQVMMFDKSRGLGGRLATRRLPNGASFDHGAQYIRVSDPALLTLMERACSAGEASRWEATIINGPSAAEDEARPRFIGQPGMSAIARFLHSEAERLARQHGAGFERYRQTRITALAESSRGMVLEDELGTQFGPFDAVIIAVPAPQAHELLSRFQHNASASVSAGLAPLLEASATPMVPCWALMAAFDQPLPLGGEALKSQGGDLVWIGTSRGSNPPANWHGYVAHATPEWSAAHLELEAVKVAPLLLAALQAALPDLDALPKPAHSLAHRWRYAFAPEASGRDCHIDSKQRLLLAGDWCVGNRAEAAFISGRAAGEACHALL